MNNKSYIVISLSSTDSVLWSQVSQSSAQSMRRNLANTQGLLSYSVTPSFISDGSLPIVGDVMNQDEALALMATAAWSEPDPID
tara:strand:+ start:1219 stop:1470 length:252 start_codon:yes stop_codon:yes gene_type:complete